MSNQNEFLKIVSGEDSQILETVRERVRNRGMLHESQQIAIKVLIKLDELGWSQKDLAGKLVVSPQQVSKIVSGQENLTIETQVKLQNILDIPILASYYEERTDDIKDKILFSVQKAMTDELNNNISDFIYQPGMIVTFNTTEDIFEFYKDAV